MFFRLFRLRFVLVRGCLISLVITFFIQVWKISIASTPPFYNSAQAQDLPTKEISYWEQLSRRDGYLTNRERIRALEDLQKRSENTAIDWTAVLLDSYERKSVRLSERDFQSPYKVSIKNDQQNIREKLYEIYEETTVFDRPKFCSATRIFHPQCPFFNCQWICEEPATYYQHRRRASVFHHSDIKPDAMHTKLQRRSFNDIWILWIDEANRPIDYLNAYQFNWTLSFRQDSEVSIGSYGILIRKDRNRIPVKEYSSMTDEFVQILYQRNLQVSDISLEDRILSNFRYRHRHALWFVSNCLPQYRLNYYEQLNKHYPIRAFGSCVKNKCDKSHACESDQSYQALFYLAFESQTCTDYITEKFWRSLHYGMIPIVLGPSKKSYLDLGVPASAFIHVGDYLSAEDLAKHLHLIANDYFLYRKYFQWLNEFDVLHNVTDLEPLRMCELCMRLNMQHSQDHSYYTNINRWHHEGCEK